MNPIDAEIRKLLGTVDGGWHIDRIETYEGIETIGDMGNRRQFVKVTLVHPERHVTVTGEAFDIGAALEYAVNSIFWLANQ